jgi:hypothetical protein
VFILNIAVYIYIIHETNKALNSDSTPLVRGKKQKGTIRKKRVFLFFGAFILTWLDPLIFRLYPQLSI